MVVAPHAAWLLPLASTTVALGYNRHPLLSIANIILCFSLYLYLLIVYTISVQHCLSNGIISFLGILEFSVEYLLTEQQINFLNQKDIESL